MKNEKGVNYPSSPRAILLTVLGSAMLLSSYFVAQGSCDEGADCSSRTELSLASGMVGCGLLILSAHVGVKDQQGGSPCPAARWG